MKYTTMIFWGLLLTAVVMTCAGCIFVAGTHKHEECPVCEECTEGIEDPYLCSKYYAEKEALHIEAQKRMETLIGSHDFFLEGEDKITSSLIATKCLTCGIHFTHPSYGEHIKTCCP